MWHVYWENAVERLEASKLLLEHKLLNGACEDAFLAIEIAIKAWIVRVEPDLGRAKDRSEAGRLGFGVEVTKAFFGHSPLKLLYAFPTVARELQVGEPLVYNLLLQVSGDAQSWKPWQRYQARADAEIIRLYLKVAEGLQKWMLSNSLLK